MKLISLAGTVLLAFVALEPAAQAQRVNFTYTGTLVTFTVPATGLYQILAFGAQGGTGTYDNFIGAGGLGAESGGDFALMAGESLQIAVGGVGSDSGGAGAGGGGGSFVVGPGNTPLVIAGGGGGGAGDGDGPLPGGGGLTGPDGSCFLMDAEAPVSSSLVSSSLVSSSAPVIGRWVIGRGAGSPGGGSPTRHDGSTFQFPASCTGGTGGNGGPGGGGERGGGGGGGFLSAGGNGNPVVSVATGGGAFPTLMGGFSGGGFGGGGGADLAAGGGGGYSGGGGGCCQISGGIFPGGGGGSFDSGIDQILVADLQTGNGEVVISAVFLGTPGPNCYREVVSALALQYGDLAAAAALLGYSRVHVLRNNITTYCAR